MPRSILMAIVFMILGSGLTIAQDKDPKPDTSASFEGKVAGDRRELAPGIFFRWCPAGKFKMGEGDTAVDVELTKPFWLGETEVTQEQWQKLMGTTPWTSPEFVKDGDRFAASYISHNDAVEFEKKLTMQQRVTGKLPMGWKFSLPTESQWEYACRAGTTTIYSFGDNESELSEYAWWGGFVLGGNTQNERYAHPVGLKQANAWGLRDMHGNVWEWCSDWHDNKLAGGRDPVGPPSGSNRVYRGGSWNYKAAVSRSAFRYRHAPEHRFYDCGFRVAALPE